MPAAQEDAVTRALGPFGLWQARGCLLVALVKIPAAWQMLTIIFSAPQPFTVGGSFWCARPSDHWSIERWINLSHPKIIKLDGSDGFNPCKIFDVEYPVHEPDDASISYSTTATRSCEKFEIQQDFPSVVTQWSLVCSRETLVNVIQHFYLEGIFFGGIVTFLLLKKLSPRVVLATGATLQIAAGLGLAFAPYYEIHMALKMLTGLGACVMFSAGFQICWDITNGWQRIVICVCYEHFWSIGVISLGWLSDLAGSWVNLQIIISVPTVLILLLIQFVPDSPRWFIAAGILEQAEKILRQGASFNNRDLASEFEIKPTSCAAPVSAPPPKLPMARVLALGLIWIITVVHYYGGLLNMRSNGGPRLPARTSLAGVAEVIGAMIGMILLLRCRPGLKFAFLSSLLAIGGTACVSSWALNPTRGGGRSGWPMLCMALAGRISIACSLAVMSCGGCAELIPLPRRPLTMLALVSLARMALTSAPFINSLASYGESVTLSIYGVMCLSGAAAACYLAVDLLLEQRKQRASEKLQNILAMRPSTFYTKQIQRNSCMVQHNGHYGYPNGTLKRMHRDKKKGVKIEFHSKMLRKFPAASDKFAPRMFLLLTESL